MGENATLIPKNHALGNSCVSQSTAKYIHGGLYSHFVILA
jgi:hypothetical protein